MRWTKLTDSAAYDLVRFYGADEKTYEKRLEILKQFSNDCGGFESFIFGHQPIQAFMLELDHARVKNSEWRKQWDDDSDMVDYTHMDHLRTFKMSCGAAVGIYFETKGRPGKPVWAEDSLMYLSRQFVLHPDYKYIAAECPQYSFLDPDTKSAMVVMCENDLTKDLPIMKYLKEHAAVLPEYVPTKKERIIYFGEKWMSDDDDDADVQPWYLD